MQRQSVRRNTRQRQVILDELRQVTSHPTAAALYERVRRRLPKISLGTVYRNLELLARTGLIRKLDIGGSEARFDGNMAEHNHVRCVRCGRIGDLAARPLDVLPEDAKDWGGFQILGYRMELFGICPDCRRARTIWPARSMIPIPPT